MSTLSFQDYVRERMLRRRRPSWPAQAPAPAEPRRPRPAPPSAAAPGADRGRARRASGGRADARVPVLREAGCRQRRPAPRQWPSPALAARAADSDRDADRAAFDEGLIEERFGALAFMERLQRQPRQAHADAAAAGRRASRRR